MAKKFVRGALKHDFLSVATGIAVGSVIVADTLLAGGAVMGSTLAAKAAGCTFGLTSGFLSACGVAAGRHGVGLDESDISAEVSCECDKPDCCVAEGVKMAQSINLK